LAKEEQLFISVQIDEHIGKALAVSLKRNGYDVVTTAEAGLLGASDSEQLAHAAATKRAILTFNIRDFRKLHERWQAEGKEHSGIILSQKLPVGELLRRMLKLLNTLTADEIHNQVIFLSDFA
jgi:predicted nuclease of predicted toxin-antitoxin system